MDIYEGFLLWVIKNVRFAALIIAGVILGTCFIKMWHYGDVFSTEYLIVYINSNVCICKCMAGGAILQIKEVHNIGSIHDYPIQKIVCILAMSV